MSTEKQDFILTIRAPDRPGILAAVTDSVFRAGCDIRDAQQFGDPGTGVFFIRIHLAAEAGVPADAIEQALQPVAGRLQLGFEIHPWQRRTKVLIAVSKFGHCLNDLLHRWHSGLLHADIVGVMSNHEQFRSLTEWHGLAFHHFPISADTRKAQEEKVLELIDTTGADLLVLARYMQILSPELCQRLAGRCINIHHSFLPSFKGAMPYKRAYERGVKLIGATAHYVTADLDEGPIIEQDVARVTHAMDATELANLGREVEMRVLSRAVRWHVEHKVILNGSKTIVFA